MIEKGRAPVVRSNVAIAGEDFSTIPKAGRTHLRDLVTCEIVEEIYGRAADRLANAPAIAVVDIRDVRAHLDNAVLRIVGKWTKMGDENGGQPDPPYFLL